jgi:hypothetical protein
VCTSDWFCCVRWNVVCAHRKARPASGIRNSYVCCGIQMLCMVMCAVVFRMFGVVLRSVMSVCSSMLECTILFQVTSIVIICINRRELWCGMNQFGLCALPRVILCSLMLIVH